MNNNNEDRAGELMSELDELSKGVHKLSHKEATQILEDYSRVLICLVDSFLFPLCKPKSLLPREKEIVLESLAVCLLHSTPDSDYRNSIYWSYIEVKEYFVDDEISFEKNKKLISNPEYWKGIKEIKADN